MSVWTLEGLGFWVGLENLFSSQLSEGSSGNNYWFFLETKWQCKYRRLLTAATWYGVVCFKYHPSAGVVPSQVAMRPANDISWGSSMHLRRCRNNISRLGRGVDPTANCDSQRTHEHWAPQGKGEGDISQACGESCPRLCCLRKCH